MARSTTGLAYATLGVTILGVLIFIVFVTVPAWADLRAARTHLANEESSLEHHRQFLANVDARAAELKRYEADARVLAVALPDSASAADLDAVLAALAEKNQISITSVSGPTSRRETASSEVSSGKSEAYETVVKATGTYAAMSGFLRDIEKSARLIDVPAIDLSARTDGTLDGSFRLLTHAVVRRDQSPVALPTTPAAVQPTQTEPRTP